MKTLLRHTLLYIAAIVLTVGLCQCQKYSDEDHEGQWQLVEIALPDGTMTEDVKANGVYWRMQLGILQIVCTGIPEENNLGEVIARIEVSDGRLRLTEIYHSQREADILITDPADAATLRPYGITAPVEDYAINTLTNNHMVLTSDNLRLTFRKF